MFLLLRNLVFIAVIISASDLILAEQDLRQTILEAQQSSLKNIKSGAMTGTVKISTPKNETEEWQLDSSADLDGKFLDRKYYLKLQYATKGKHDYDKTITICDLAKIMTSRFSPRIHPAAAEGYIFALQEPPAVGNISPFAGFPWDLSKPMLFDVEHLLKRKDAKQFPLKLNADGDITGEITTELSSTTYLFSKSSGYNFTGSKTVNLKTGKTRSESQVKWKQIDDIWVMMAFSRTHHVAASNEEKNEVPSQRVEVEFTKYDLNCAVDKKTFAFSSLELPLTARIVDHRPDALIRTYLQYPTAKKLSTTGEIPPNKPKAVEKP